MILLSHCIKLTESGGISSIVVKCCRLHVTLQRMISVSCLFSVVLLTVHDLRKCTHDRVLPDRLFCLADSNFIVRMLFHEA